MLIIALAVLAGACLWTALHHAWIGLRRPPRPEHAWFALLSLSAAMYVLNKVSAYTTTTADALVAASRVEASLAIITMVLLPWFVRAYTGSTGRRMPLLLAVFGGVLIIANLVLPGGVIYEQLPPRETFTLPWGEVVTALHLGRGGLWYQMAWVLIASSFLYSLCLGLRKYRAGTRRKAAMLLTALGVFLMFALFNRATAAGWISITLTSEFGYIALVILMSSSLTNELRRNADELAASESRFRTLVEQSPFSIQVVAPNGRTLRVNRAWESLWGVGFDALAGYNLLEDQQLIAKGVMPLVRRGFDGEAAEIPPIQYNPAETVVVPGGPVVRDRWVRAFIYPVKDHVGSITEVILMHEDVTDRKWTDDALRHIAAGVSARTGEDFFEQLVLHLTAVFGADYAFVARLHDDSPNIATTIAVCADGAIAPNMTYALEHTPCENVTSRSICAYVSGVQQQFPQDELLARMDIDSYIGAPLVDVHGKPLGLLVLLSKKPLEPVARVREILKIVAARTIAELQRLDAERELEAHRVELERRVQERTRQLEVANRELEAFSYSVSHDLRAPLRAIDGFARILNEDYGAGMDPEARGYLDRVHHAALRMSKLIDDLLNLSRVARAELHGDTVDLSQLAREAVMELQRAEPQRSVTVEIASGMKSTGDAALLRVALHNLLGNAWKYTRFTDHALIEIGETEHSGLRCFYVRDNGVGFDMQLVGKLFTPFQRLHSAQEFDGTGVGLATVSRIVHRHGGQIWAEAEPGRGATFYFTLGGMSETP